VPILRSFGALRLFAESLPIILQSDPPLLVAQIWAAPANAASEAATSATLNPAMNCLLRMYANGFHARR